MSRAGWHYGSVDAVRNEAGVADQSDECRNGTTDCPGPDADIDELPCLECLADASDGEREVATDGGERVDGIDRPDPKDDPFACSGCGCAIGSGKRLRGDEYCDACAREYGLKPPMQRCFNCGDRAPLEEMDTIDISPPDEYYPEIRYLCQWCSTDTETDQSEGEEA